MSRTLLWNKTRILTLPMMIATRRGVESSPSETMRVVAQAGGWIASVAIIAQLVNMIEIVALAANRNPSTENGGGVAVMETPEATITHATKPAIPPIR
jgi:coenzyme F420-reducing hydrogenase alpha subunit